MTRKRKKSVWDDAKDQDFFSAKNMEHRSRQFFGRRSFNRERGKAGSHSSNAGRYCVGFVSDGNKFAAIRMTYDDAYCPTGRPFWYGSEKGAKNAAERLPGDWEYFKCPTDTDAFFKTRHPLNPRLWQWFWRIPEEGGDDEDGKKKFAKPPAIRIWSYISCGIPVYGTSSMDGRIAGAVVVGAKKYDALQAYVDGLIQVKDLIPVWESEENKNKYEEYYGKDEDGNQLHWFSKLKLPLSTKEKKRLEKQGLDTSGTSKISIQNTAVSAEVADLFDLD